MLNSSPVTLRDLLHHSMRAYYWPATAGTVLAASAFMPWITVGNQQYGGVPDLAGIWVLGLAVAAVILAGLSIATRKNSRHPLLLVGLASFGIVLLAERLMVRTATQQGWAVSQAQAIVQGGQAATVIEPVMATGAYVGLAASTAIALFGLTVVVKRAPRIHAEATDDDV